MKITQRVGRIPDGSQPAVGVSVAARRIDDGTTLATVLTDAEGLATFTANGHWPPFFLFIGNVPGGDKTWRSDDAKTAGPINLPELPVALRVFGDGVIRGYGSELAVSLVSNGPTVSVASGAANVAGHPFVVYSAVQLSNTRPSSGTRTDRVILRLYPTGSDTTPGKADLVLLQGAIDAGAPALTTTSTVHEVALYQVSVPAAGAITLTDERVHSYSGEKPPMSDIARTDSVATSHGSGEALDGLAITLLLPRPATYQIEAELAAVQDVATGWSLATTVGGTGAGNGQLNTPGQVAVDSSGNVYVADTVNNRIVKLTSSGAYVGSITGLTSPTGVCVDASGNIYVVHNVSSLRKYNSSFVQQWSVGGASARNHIATDGTHLYTAFATSAVQQRSCATGGHVATFGSAGSGAGQFNNPHGICMAASGSSIFVVDSGNNRIQRIGTGGSIITKWGSLGSNDGQFNAPRGIARDSAGNLWVADYGNDRLQQFTDGGGSPGVYQQTIAQANPHGVALAEGDVLWVSNADADTLAKWDELPGGYGQVALEVDGNLSPYSGIGQRRGALSMVETGSAEGPGTVLIRAFGKATADTMQLRSCVLSAQAVPNR